VSEEAYAALHEYEVLIIHWEFCRCNAIHTKSCGALLFPLPHIVVHPVGFVDAGDVVLAHAAAEGYEVVELAVERAVGA